MSEGMNCPAGGCQAREQDEFSAPRQWPWLWGPGGVPRRMLPIGLIETVLLCLRSEGVAAVWARTCRLRRRGFAGTAARRQPSPLPAIPRAIGLRPGELVEVRPLEEIESTLDENGRLGGLAFTSEMRAYCGRRFRVFERLELLYNEYTHRQRTVKNTVLLEGVYCHGVGFGCHRRCFHFWREAWLKRVEGTGSGA